MEWSLIKIKVVSLQFKIKALEGNINFKLATGTRSLTQNIKTLIQ